MPEQSDVAITRGVWMMWSWLLTAATAAATADERRPGAGEGVRLGLRRRVGDGNGQRSAQTSPARVKGFPFLRFFCRTWRPRGLGERSM
nr:hypothetical protein CFP56_21601 [Quercus suber]